MLQLEMTSLDALCKLKIKKFTLRFFTENNVSVPKTTL